MNFSRFVHLRLQGASPDATVFNGEDDNKQTSQTTTNYGYSPAEQQARDYLFNQGLSLAQKNQGAAYPGASPIAPSTLTDQARSMLVSTATGPGQDIANSAASALKFGFGDVLNPSTNPALAANINSAVRRVGEEYTNPTGPLATARGYFTGNNSGGTGTREGIASGLIARDYMNKVGDVTAKMQSDAYNQGLDTFEKTLAFSPNAFSLMLQPAAAVGAAGAQEDSIAAIQEQYDAAKRNWELQGGWSMLSPYANLTSSLTQPTVTSNKEATVSRTQQLMQALGLGMMGYGLFAG